jgi:hypothetical protein
MTPTHVELRLFDAETPVLFYSRAAYPKDNAKACDKGAGRAGREQKVDCRGLSTDLGIASQASDDPIREGNNALNDEILSASSRYRACENVLYLQMF